MTKVIILDGYIDEPTCLGVPPYISPYPRYIAGAITTANPKINVQYFTIDQLRNNPEIIKSLNSADYLIVIAGVAVPGKYLSSYPMSPKEVRSICSKITIPKKILCGPAAKLGYALHGGKKPKNPSDFNKLFDVIVSGDCEIFCFSYFSENESIDAISPTITRKHAHQIDSFAIKGAKIVSQHPYFPNRLITEIETYRGCPRSIAGGCSFCPEPQKGPPDFRPIKDITSEVKALYQNHIRHIRLGNQPCIFSYQAKDAHSKEFPTPNPTAIKTLFKEIREVAPDLKTFHIDNANPGVIARHPEKSNQIAEHIISYHTSGDVAAFGVESIDPGVIEKNNLKATEEEVITAIKILNAVGAQKGNNGLPELLPGLNFLYGLIGERKKTFSLNFQFLKRIIQENLLVRRINIRQVIPLRQTFLDQKLSSKQRIKHHTLFIQFKKAVSQEINKPLLKRMIPIGTKLTDVIAEQKKGHITFGRQMGSYPLLIGIASPIPIHSSIDVTIVDHGFRSVTAVPHPLPINTATLHTLQALPMIGKKRAMRLIRQRPYDSSKEIPPVFDDPLIGKRLIEMIPLTFIK